MFVRFHPGQDASLKVNTLRKGIVHKKQKPDPTRMLPMNKLQSSVVLALIS